MFARARFGVTMCRVLPVSTAKKPSREEGKVYLGSTAKNPGSQHSQCHRDVGSAAEIFPAQSLAALRRLERAKVAKGDPRRPDACMWVPRGSLDRPRVERDPAQEFQTSLGRTRIFEIR